MQKWCRLLLLSRIPPKDCSMLHCFGCMVSMCFHWLLAFGIHSSSLGSKAFSGARAHFFCQEKQQEESSHHAHSANSPHGQILKLTTCPKDPKAQLWYSTSAPSELKAHSWWDYVIYVAFLKCSSDSSLLKWLKFRITPFTSLWGESHDGGKEGKDVLKDVCKEIEELPPSKPEAIREADHPGMIETFCGNTHRDTSARGKLC